MNCFISGQTADLKVTLSHTVAIPMTFRAYAELVIRQEKDAVYLGKMEALRQCEEDILQCDDDGARATDDDVRMDLAVQLMDLIAEGDELKARFLKEEVGILFALKDEFVQNGWAK